MTVKRITGARSSTDSLLVNSCQFLIRYSV